LKAVGHWGRFQYEELRGAACVYLDLLGISPGTSIEVLERAQNFEDPRVALFAIISLLKRKSEPAQVAIERCASSHAVRDVCSLRNGAVADVSVGAGSRT
jgi:hypothetical protein